jgi:multidrug efflux pump subunit AcrA (membrane-fusion protein)
MDTLQKANANGLALARSMQQMSAAQVQAMDKLLSLEAEKTSLETEITANKGALQQVSGAYADLQRTYGSGVLTAPASGYVGSHVGMVGEVLSAGTTPVANIYAGTSYILAYIPENYLFDVDEGQKVSIKGRGRTATGYIERVLPVTDALPPEFQLPNRVRGRGQLVRVELSQPKDFALDEKVRLTSCYMDKCGLGISEIIEAAIPEFLRGGNRAVATAERPQPAAADAREKQQPTTQSEEPVSSHDQPAPDAPITGSIGGLDVPLTGIVVEPSRMHESVFGNNTAPPLPEAPITGSLQERAQTPPNT